MLRIHQLFLYLDASAGDGAAEACTALWRDLSRRSWSHALRLVDRLDPVPLSRPNTQPMLRTVGYAMELPDPGSAAAGTIARTDVERLVAAASGLAAATGLAFVIEYDDDRVGVLDGRPADVAFTRELFGGI